MRDEPPPLAPPHEAALACIAALKGGACDEWRQAADHLAGCDVVLMVGSPASGKSTFAAHILGARGFQCVGQDQARSSAACKAQMLSILDKYPAGQVVVDNTHRDPAARAAYIGAARRARPRARIGIAWVQTPKQLCEHLDGLRCHRDPAGRTPTLPRMVIPAYWKNFEAPGPDEADCIVAVEFRPCSSATHPDLYEKVFAS